MLRTYAFFIYLRGNYSSLIPPTFLPFRAKPDYRVCQSCTARALQTSLLDPLLRRRIGGCNSESSWSQLSAATKYEMNNANGDGESSLRNSISTARAERRRICYQFPVTKADFLHAINHSNERKDKTSGPWLRSLRHKRLAGLEIRVFALL